MGEFLGREDIYSLFMDTYQYATTNTGTLLKLCHHSDGTPYTRTADLRTVLMDFHAFLNSEVDRNEQV